MSAIRDVVLAMLAFGLGLRRARPASAQTYPTKPMHIIVPTSRRRHHRHAGARAGADS